MNNRRNENVASVKASTLPPKSWMGKKETLVEDVSNVTRLGHNWETKGVLPHQYGGSDNIQLCSNYSGQLEAGCKILGRIEHLCEPCWKVDVQIIFVTLQ